jgi:hypothetical protein
MWISALPLISTTERRGIPEPDADIVSRRYARIDSLATPVGNGVHVFDEMRPHVASFRVFDCSVSDYRCGVQLWGWLTKVRDSSTGREDYIGIPRIDHNPDGKTATVLRDGDLLRWIDSIRASRHYMELFQYGCGHGG